MHAVVLSIDTDFVADLRFETVDTFVRILVKEFEEVEQGNLNQKCGKSSRDD
jgi:hypothetical protein